MPDKRLDKLAEMYEPEKFTPATIEFVDIAGLVKGASKGEGLGNKFLSNIREVDAVVHVVRCFENDDIIHVEGSIDPARDIETIDLELILSDIEVLDRRIDKTKKMIKADKKYQSELEFFERVHEALDAGKPVADRGIVEQVTDLDPEHRRRRGGGAQEESRPWNQPGREAPAAGTALPPAPRSARTQPRRSSARSAHRRASAGGLAKGRSSRSPGAGESGLGTRPAKRRPSSGKTASGAVR